MRTLLILFTCTLLGVATACHRVRPADPRVLATFQDSTDILNDLSLAPSSVVPDAVLNRTRCLIVVPAAGTTIRERVGAAACRDEDNKWRPPALITFTPGAHEIGDALIFILNQDMAGRVGRGKVSLAGKWVARAGPAVQKVVTVTDADLAADAFSYVRTDKVLAAKALSGLLVLQQNGDEIVAAESPASRQLANAVASFFNTIMPLGIILHHSAVIPGESSVPTSTREVDEFHRERGFAILCQGREYHVAYHYLVLPDGTVKAGRPERCQGAHARGYNASLGIALVGDFSSTDNPRGDKGPTQPTREQFQAVVLLCRKIMEKYDIPLQRVMRHSDVASTRCPGDRFPFAEILQSLQGRK